MCPKVTEQHSGPDDDQENERKEPSIDESDERDGGDE